MGDGILCLILRVALLDRDVISYLPPKAPLMNQQRTNLIRALLHGLTGAGLFRRLDYPGASEFFVDPRPVEEIVASGEFDAMCRKLLVRQEGAKQPS
jgi:hypothetical protein